jgi:hypothetical protein
MATFWEKRAFGEASREPDALAKAGRIFLLSQYISVASGVTVPLALVTNGVTVRLHFYEILSTEAAIKAALVEAPTYTASSSNVVGRNLNRNFSDTHTVTFENVTNLSGGTVIATEYVGTAAKAGGELSQSRIHTLKKDTKYVMTFQNVGNKTTEVHLNLGWSENVPEGPPFWPQP